MKRIRKVLAFPCLLTLLISFFTSCSSTSSNPQAIILEGEVQQVFQPNGLQPMQLAFTDSYAVTLLADEDLLGKSIVLGNSLEKGTVIYTAEEDYEIINIAANDYYIVWFENLYGIWSILKAYSIEKEEIIEIDWDAYNEATDTSDIWMSTGYLGLSIGENLVPKLDTKVYFLEHDDVEGISTIYQKWIGDSMWGARTEVVSRPYAKAKNGVTAFSITAFKERDFNLIFAYRDDDFNYHLEALVAGHKNDAGVYQHPKIIKQVALPDDVNYVYAVDYDAESDLLALHYKTSSSEAVGFIRLHTVTEGNAADIQTVFNFKSRSLTTYNLYPHNITLEDNKIIWYLYHGSFGLISDIPTGILFDIEARQASEIPNAFGLVRNKDSLYALWCNDEKEEVRRIPW